MSEVVKVATIKDVARVSGLSVGTVSHYLNGKKLRAESKGRIEKAINDLDFSVNSMARGLKTNKSGSIGVVSNDLMSVFSIKVIEIIEDYFEKQGYSVVLCNSRDDMENERRKLKFLKDKMVDGIILFPASSENTHIADIVKDDIPLVIIDHLLKDTEYDSVLVDNVNGAYQAIEHLINMGHSNIAIITGRQDISNAVERLEGYRRALVDYGISIREENIKYGDFSIRSGYEKTLELIQSPYPPSALFLANYHMAVGAINALNEKQVGIPQDISVTAFDMNLTDFDVFSITSVVQPINQIGIQASQILLERINGNSLKNRVMLRLKTQFIVRDSVKRII